MFYTGKFMINEVKCMVHAEQGHCRSIYLPPGISNNGELNEIRAL